MSWIMVVGILFIFIIGFFILAHRPSANGKTREQILEGFARHVEGQWEPIEGKENSCRISFLYDREAFVFEEIDVKGFRERILKGFLRYKTTSRFSLIFSEKEPKTTLRSEVLIASRIPDEVVEQDKKVQIPGVLGAYHIYTNEVERANKLMQDKDAVNIFARFKNSDGRGYPFMSLRVLDGEVILEFHMNQNFKPSLLALHSNVASIDKYLDTLLELGDKIRQYQD